MNIECWILNIESECWNWTFGLNIEYWIQILNLSFESQYLIWLFNLNFELEYWILNVKIKCYWGWFRYERLWLHLRLQTSDILFLWMCWCWWVEGWLFFVLGDYCAKCMVIQYLLMGTMLWTDDIVEFGISTASGCIHWRYQS